MDVNLYALEALTRDRLAELRAGAELHGQIHGAVAIRRPLRVTFGLTLIRVGIWALGAGRNPLAPRTS